MSEAEPQDEQIQADSPESGQVVPDTPDAEASSEDGVSEQGMQWYVLRVASNKEEQVRATLTRKIAIEGLEDRIDRILVPTLKERRMRAGKVRVHERKLYPGYVFVEMKTDEDGSIPEHIWFLVKETTGVGDFIGADGKPIAMQPMDVEKMLDATKEPEEGEVGLAGIGFSKGDLVKVREGPFENFEGMVEEINAQKGIVRVIVTIFGRPTPIELEYLQIELA